MGLMLGGCSVSRYDQLRARSGEVGAELKTEQARALSLADDASRQQRLDHLTSLHYTHSAADVALGTVRRVIPADQRDLAYDVLDEVYDTIEWNIPLGPGEAKRPMPAGFAGNALRLNAQSDPLVQPIAN